MVFDILSSEKICETSTSCLIVIIALKQHIQTNIDMYPLNNPKIPPKMVLVCFIGENLHILKINFDIHFVSITKAINNTAVNEDLRISIIIGENEFTIFCAETETVLLFIIWIIVDGVIPFLGKNSRIGFGIEFKSLSKLNVLLII